MDAPAPAQSGDSAPQPSFALRLQRSLKRQLQHALDRSVPMLLARWLALAALLTLYVVRVYLLKGFYIVSYGLGIFLLSLFIGFLTPIEDAEGDGGPLLPTSGGDEFKPFIRRLPEFKFWYGCAKAVLTALALTFFSVFDIPVFWPILLMYFLVLFVLTMKRQIRHMIKYKYVPFSLGKRQYGKGNKVTVRDDSRAK